MLSRVAKYVSIVLSAIATLVVSPYSAGLIHQPKAPKELYKQ